MRPARSPSGIGSGTAPQTAGPRTGVVGRNGHSEEGGAPQRAPRLALSPFLFAASVNAVGRGLTSKPPGPTGRAATFRCRALGGKCLVDPTARTSNSPSPRIRICSVSGAIASRVSTAAGPEAHGFRETGGACARLEQPVDDATVRTNMPVEGGTGAADEAHPAARRAQVQLAAPLLWCRCALMTRSRAA